MVDSVEYAIIPLRFESRANSHPCRKKFLWSDVRHDSHESYTIVKPVQIPTQFLQTNARLLPSLYGKLYCGGGNNAVLDESVKMGLGYLHLPGFVSLSLFIFYRTRGQL